MSTPIGTSLVERPWLAPLVWIVLHSSDYYLTLAGARLARLNKVVEYEGSYELNPVMRAPVDEQRPFSKRFVLSLIGVALILLFVVRVAPMVGFVSPTAFLIGMIIFTRVGVIALHLENLLFFRRACRESSPISGRVRYDRKTLYVLAAARYSGLAAIMTAAALFSSEPVPYPVDELGFADATAFLFPGNPFLMGGAFGWIVLAAIATSAAARRPVVPEYPAPARQTAG